MRTTTIRLTVALILAVALTGCGTLGFGGGEDSRLGDGQIDVLRLLAIAGGIQSGDAGPLCETILAGQAGGDEATEGLLLAACRGLLGQMAGPQSPLAARAVVAPGSAVEPGPACEELRIAWELTANACRW